MSKDKYCGNCMHFKYEDVNGCGICDVYGVKAETNESGCNAHTLLSEYNNGWTEITPDNMEELYPVIDRVIVAYKLDKGLAGYSSLTELYKPLKDLALTGGYYYYVLPELNIDGTE